MDNWIKYNTLNSFCFLLNVFLLHCTEKTGFEVWANLENICRRKFHYQDWFRGSILTEIFAAATYESVNNGSRRFIGYSLRTILHLRMIVYFPEYKLPLHLKAFIILHIVPWIIGIRRIFSRGGQKFTRGAKTSFCLKIQQKGY